MSWTPCTRPDCPWEAHIHPLAHREGRAPHAFIVCPLLHTRIVPLAGIQDVREAHLGDV